MDAFGGRRGAGEYIPQGGSMAVTSWMRISLLTGRLSSVQLLHTGCPLPDPSGYIVRPANFEEARLVGVQICVRLV